MIVFCMSNVRISTTVNYFSSKLLIYCYSDLPQTTSFVPLTKSSAIHLFRVQICPKTLQHNLHNSPIPLTSSLKILSLIFDDKLSWMFHILNLTASCAERLNTLHKLSHTIYEANRISLSNLQSTHRKSNMVTMYTPQHENSPFLP